MKTLTALFLGLLFLGGCDATSCEEPVDCVILCECPNGADAIGSGYRCVAGTCRDGHAADRDCDRICSNAVPPIGGGDDDDTTATGNDDDSGADDDDSGNRR